MASFERVLLMENQTNLIVGVNRECDLELQGWPGSFSFTGVFFRIITPPNLQLRCQDDGCPRRSICGSRRSIQLEVWSLVRRIIGAVLFALLRAWLRGWPGSFYFTEVDSYLLRARLPGWPGSSKKYPVSALWSSLSGADVGAN